MHVFGYGSLVARADGIPCALRDHRRCWGVAMDNTRDLPGYKFYVDPATGERPPVFVAFLDLEQAPGSSVDGTALPVDVAELAALDDRERNYARVDVTAWLSVDLGGPVWTYVGSAEGRERFARGVRDGTAVISAEYLELVPAIAHDGLPVRELTRLPVPLSP